MKRNTYIPLGALVLVFAIAPAFAETRIENPASHPVVSQHLKDFKAAAFQLRKEASTVKSYIPGNRMSQQSHYFRLGNLRDQVNDLGKKLAQIEQLHPVSGDTQQLAMENARPHLAAVAQNLTDAIQLYNENRNNVNFTDYAEAIRNVYDHSDSLYEKVDTLLDYESAKARVESLDLETESGEGS